ncbi:MAG: hypothetical protein ACI85U_003829 [Candidatus Promineifilaceae bacterium]|jgi:hypothetical protein
MQADFSRIQQELTKWDGRRRLQALLVWGPRGLMAGLMVALLLAILSRFRPLLTNREIGYAALICAGVGLVGGILFATLRRYSVYQQAIYADRQLGLRERITSALELHEGKIEAPADIRRFQLEDTLSIVKQVDVETSIPLTFDSQELMFILVAIAFILAAVVFPNGQASILQGQRAVQQVVDEQIERLETLEEEIVQNETLNEEQREELLAPISDARETLEEGVGSREEALATLSEAESELRELAERSGTENLEGQMAEAGSNISSSAGEPLSEAMTEGDLNETAEALDELSESVNGLGAEEQQELGRDLSQAAAELQESDPELAQELAEAGSALQQGDVESAQQALAEASETAGELAEQGEMAAAAQQAAEELTEGRQQVAKSENGQPNEEGQSEPGEGQQPGENGQPQPGQAEQPGSGQQPGVAQPAPGAGGEQGGASAGEGGGGSTDNVFVPPFRDLSEFEGVEVELSAECEASPENCGELLNTTPSEIRDEESVVPYEEVYAEYANTAYESLAEDYIPIGMKGYIRDYFSSLEPETE